MATNRSEKSRYPSRYSPSKWVTPAQYIIELVCENKARFENKSPSGDLDLPLQFWKLPEWQKFFGLQTKAVNQILKKWDEKVVIKVVKEKKIRFLSPARTPAWIIKVLNQEQKIFDAQKEKAEREKALKPKPTQRIIDVPTTRKKEFGSTLDKMLAFDESIDDGEEENEE